MSSVGYIFDLKKFAIHDGPGIRTTVFFQGCPLNCRWCHNPESRGGIKKISELHNSCKVPLSNTSGKCNGSAMTIDQLMNDILKDSIFYDQSGGGVTFSGGEPMMQVEFLHDMLIACKANNIHTIVDTSGYAPIDDFNKIYDMVDLFLYDLKIMNNDEHEKYIGVSNREINENLKELSSRGDKIKIRVPMIPNVTDTKENLQSIVDFLKPLKSIKQVSLLPYNKFGEDKLKRLNPDTEISRWEPQSKEIISDTAAWMESFGYEVKIGG